MPLPGTRVIHPDWEAHHRPTAEGRMTAECSIARPSHAAAFDETAGRTVYPTPPNLYSGKCWVQALHQRGQAPVVGGAQVTDHRYMVGVPADAGEFRVNDQVTLTVCAGDGNIVGRVLRITGVLEGSLLWERDLLCQDTTPTTR